MRRNLINVSGIRYRQQKCNRLSKGCKQPSVLGDSTFAIPDAATPDTVLTMQYDSKDANTFLKYLMKMILILNYWYHMNQETII